MYKKVLAILLIINILLKKYKIKLEGDKLWGF